VAVTFLSEQGKFLASLRGPVYGNVLVRRQQYRSADSAEKACEISAHIIMGKLANSRVVLNRAVRDHKEQIQADSILANSEEINTILKRIPLATSVDEIRGLEGQAAAVYFGVFSQLIVSQKDFFTFSERNRRPPMDAVNALLSFVYTLLLHDVQAALEVVGLDPYVGFLHTDRPGRPSLALDLMEEFRSVIADRLVLTLINRKQVVPSGFSKAAQGAVAMDDDTRKTVLIEYQKRKQERVVHSYLDESVPIGLLFHIQATLLSRYIRGDIDGYPPYFWR
jgi:CRISPR-associated protein Cas1